MANSIQGSFYDQVILQIMIPGTVDVSAEDYEAKVIDNYGREASGDPSEKQRPFVVLPTADTTLKVETWLGKVIVWTFKVGEPPILLRKILHDAVNNSIQTGIRIGY